MGVKLATVIREAMDARLAEVQTTAPGKIVKYDAATETATVELMIYNTIENGAGEILYEKFQPIEKVKVIFPKGGGSYIKWKLVPGDGVALVFSSVDPSGYQKSGELNEPQDLSRHSVSHPVAIAGWAPSASLGAVVEDDALEIEAPEIRLGTQAEELIARADRVEAQLDAIANAVNGHTHTYSWTGTAGSGSTGGAVKYSPGAVGCDKVKGI